MKISEVIQTPGEEFDLLKESILSELHVALPGVVQSFDSTSQTATIRPAIRSRKDGKNIEIPLLTDVPVFFPGGAAGALTYPVSAGDECLVIFADGCIDAWMQNGGVSNAISLRKHDYSDGFAFVGFRSRPKRIESFPSHPSVFGIGEVISGTPVTTDVPSATNTKIQSLTLGAGTYIITAGFKFVDDFTNLSAGRIDQGGLGVSGTQVVSKDGNGGGYNASAIVTVTESTDFDLISYQGSGTSRSVESVMFKAVRIA